MAHAALVVTLLVWSFSFLAAARLRQSVGLVDSVAARFLPVVLGSGLLLLWRRPLRLPRSSWWKIAAMDLSSALVLALAPLSWACYTVIGRRMPAAADALDTTYALLFVGGLPLAALAGPQLVKTLLADRGALAAALYLALPCTLFGYAVWIWALKRLPAGEVAAFVFLNPPLATLWAWLFEDQPLRPPFVLGALVLLVGVAGIVLPPSRVSAASASPAAGGPAPPTR